MRGKLELRAFAFRFAVGTSLVSGVAAAPSAAWAESRAERELTRLTSALEQSDPAASQAAIEGLAALGTPASIATLQAFVRAGRADPVTDRVVGALSTQPTPAALPLLVELSHHRRAAVRIAAHGALAKLQASEATTLVAEGLRDGQSEVRGNAARLLGERGDRAAVEVLFLAFERGVPEAAEALGRLAPAQALPRYDAYLGRRALHVMLSGYTRFMERADIDEASKLQIVATLEQVSGPVVKQWLRSQLAARTKPAEQRVRFAIAASIPRVVEGASGAEKAAGAAPGAEKPDEAAPKPETAP